MTRLRWLAMTLGPPLLYLALICQAMRPPKAPKAVYTFANPTVVTVTDSGGPRP